MLFTIIASFIQALNTQGVNLSPDAAHDKHALCKGPGTTCKITCQEYIEVSFLTLLCKVSEKGSR